MRRIILVAAAFATVLPFAFAGQVQQASGKSFTLTNRVAPVGLATVELQNRGVLPPGVKPPKRQIPPSSTGSGGCPDASATDVRANQECTNQSEAGYFGRGEAQNETSVAVNPLDPDNILISQNDYRLGDANPGVNWSLDDGDHYGSQTLPKSFAKPILDLGGSHHYWTTCDDTSVAFDSTGEAYLLTQVFDRAFSTDERGTSTIFGVDASAMLLYRSGDGGASWSFTGSYVATSGFGEGESGGGLIDKMYMTIDNNPASPYRDRIYVVWAQYPDDGSNSPTNFSYSDDHGNSWSTPIEISGRSKQLCPITFSTRTDYSCDESQFNMPFVGPDGTVYDVFDNFNNCAGALRSIGFDCPGGEDGDNHNQVLIVHSPDGGISWSTPVKVGNYYELPDCYTYTGYDFGRACVPTAPLSGTSIFRATNYPVGFATSADDIVVSYGSYINRDSNQNRGNCTPAGISTDTFLNLYDGVGDVNGCNNDIIRSVSNNGGKKFTGTNNGVTHLPTCSRELGKTLTDQWWQWTVPDAAGRAVSSYYDRSYGDDQATGYNDFTLIRGANAVRVTDFSLPPSNEFPDANGYSTFMGDYTGLAVNSEGDAYPAWVDTRNGLYTFDSTPGADPRVLTFAGYDEDIYTASIPIP